MKSVFYLDNKGREILYVPLVFVVVNYSRNVPEIILEPKKLKLRLKRWKKGVVSLKKLIGLPEVEQEDINTILELCFQGKILEAKSYCVDVFDQVANGNYGTEWRKIKCQ